MMRRSCWLLLVVLLWASARGSESPASSSAAKFLVKNFTPDDGLPQNVVFSVVQTLDGYLWLGTGNGLARFDGVHFKTFDDDEAPELAGSKILKLFEDSRQNLWIGTDLAGVVMISAHGAVTLVHKALSEEGPLVSISEDNSGNIWFLMSKGQLYHCANGTVTAVLRNCRSLITDTSGIVWVGAGEEKVLGLGPVTSGRLAAIPVSYEVPVPNLDLLVRSKKGGYWVCADGHVQYWEKDKLQRDLGAYPWTLGIPILSGCEDPSGNLVIGTAEGVFWYDSEGHANPVEEHSRSAVFSLAFDTQDNLWIGMNGGGLDRVRLRQFQVLDGTLDFTVQSVCPDQESGVWIGFNSDRVDHWSNGTLTHYTNLWPTITAPPPRDTFNVHAVLQDRLGQVWAGGWSVLSKQAQLCFVLLLGDRFVPVQPGPAALKQTVSSIYQSRRGLLIGTEGGLGILQPPGVWSVFNSAQGLSSDVVRAIMDSPDGKVWVGTERGGLNLVESGTGLNVLEPGHVTVFRKSPDGLPSDNVNSLLLDKEGVLWIGTSSGLARFHEGHWRRYTVREGLASNRIGYLLDDEEGYLWIGSSAGLMRVSKKALDSLRPETGELVPCRLFGKADGLPTAECSSGSQPGACRTRDGRLWLPTIKGLVVVQPSALKPNTNPPPVLIESVLVDSVLQGQDKVRAEVPNAIQVPAGKQTLEVHFATLNLAAPESGQFRYRLTPHEKDWTQAEPQRRYARYTRVPAGRYSFEVKACNEDGVWNERPAVLGVVVLPPFWQTWWFIGTSTILLLGVVAGSVHYVSTQKLQRQLEAMRQQEALERERSRIARDLHDQLGANLTQVALLGEMAEADKDVPKEVEAHARQICQTARETTHALDEIVWTVNPSNDTLEGLINYVCKYAQDYLVLAGLKYRMEVPSHLPPAPISPEVRHNVFLATKEAINNVVKHANATSAWVRMTLAAEAHQFTLEIEDNGKGLKKGDENKGRSGLKNMRKRMEEVGGKFEAASGKEGGTVIKLTAPLAKV